jgi:site-specific DNA-methyltransferase (adenine-specific)
MDYKIINGDILDVLPTLEESSFDCSLCDPPYHLTSSSSSKGFNNETWDGGDIAFRKETWKAVQRVLKPGSHLMAFGGTRTFHRLVCAIEDSGMEIRDALVWMYADSRPPSTDISKAIDKEKGAIRKVVGKYRPPGMKSEWNLTKAKDERTVNTFASSRNNLDITAPETPEAKLWSGYGTALKPSCELISLSMKPMAVGYVDNALNIGVAGLNIDASRLPAEESEIGRWPKNVLLDEAASNMVDEKFPGVNRFFYCNKVSTKERNAGLPEGMVNDHSTLKPIQLATYLAKLCLPPPRATPRRILVPFSGVGSEMIGAILAGWDEVIGIENGGGNKEVAEKHIQIAYFRLKYWKETVDNTSIF